MKVTTPKQTLDRLKQLLDDQWDELMSLPQPTNDSDWRFLHGKQQGLLTCLRLIRKINEQNNYFKEG